MEVKNEISFSNTPISFVRNMILMILSFLKYWSGLSSEEAHQYMHKWLPENIDLIPLQSLPPMQTFDYCPTVEGLVPLVPQITDGRWLQRRRTMYQFIRRSIREVYVFSRLTMWWGDCISLFYVSFHLQCLFVILKDFFFLKEACWLLCWLVTKKRDWKHMRLCFE